MSTVVCSICGSEKHFGDYMLHNPGCKYSETYSKDIFDLYQRIMNPEPTVMAGPEIEKPKIKYLYFVSYAHEKGLGFTSLWIDNAIPSQEDLNRWCQSETPAEGSTVILNFHLLGQRVCDKDE